jgi:acyl-CoA thioesterase-1
VNHRHAVSGDDPVPADASGATAGQIRVCFVGDSFVQGTGDPEALGWTGRIVRSALARGHALTAFNLGIRSQTSVQIARRWQAECSERLPPGAANHVLFSFGTNDTVLQNGARRVGEHDSVLALARILAGALAFGHACAFVGPPPGAEQQAAIASLNARYAQVCAAAAVPYLDLVAAIGDDAAWFDALARGDGHHPGADGYERIARIVEAWPHWWFAAQPGARSAG